MLVLISKIQHWETNPLSVQSGQTSYLELTLISVTQFFISNGRVQLKNFCNVVPYNFRSVVKRKEYPVCYLIIPFNVKKSAVKDHYSEHYIPLLTVPLVLNPPFGLEDYTLDHKQISQYEISVGNFLIKIYFNDDTIIYQYKSRM